MPVKLWYVETQTKPEDNKDANSGINNLRTHLGSFAVAAEMIRMPMVVTNTKRFSNPTVFCQRTPMETFLKGRRILVLEDEVMILMFTEYMLADLGCTAVVSATTVDQALAFVVAQEFDAAMLDVNLNNIESYPVADALAARGVPFVFATAFDGSSVNENYRDRPVLTKPYRYEEISRMMARLIPAQNPVPFPPL